MLEIRKQQMERLNPEQSKDALKLMKYNRDIKEISHKAYPVSMQSAVSK
jgi:hypothetical protein